MKWRLRCFDEVSSTNDVVKRALREGEPEGLAVCARRQSGGYGRQGRRWASPEGGMYLSLLLRPSVPLPQLPTLSLVAGLAVREAIAGSVAPEFAEKVQVKWPNDVVFAGDSSQVQKLCGISLEAVGGGVCVGIGINVFEPLGEGRGVDGEDPASVTPRLVRCSDSGALAGSEVPDAGSSPSLELEHPAASLYFDKNRLCYLAELGFAGAGVDGVRDAVLAAFPPLYERWVGEGFAPFAGDYSSHALLTGRAIVVEDLEGGVLVEGVVAGIDGEGRLLVVDSAGAEVPVSSGEAHIAAIA